MDAIDAPDDRVVGRGQFARGHPQLGVMASAYAADRKPAIDDGVVDSEAKHVHPDSVGRVPALGDRTRIVTLPLDEQGDAANDLPGEGHGSSRQRRGV